MTINGTKIAGRMPAFIKPMRDAVRLKNKTQTRRVVKDQPPEYGSNGGKLIGVAPSTLGKGWDAQYNLDNPIWIGESPYNPGEIRYMTEPLVNMGPCTAHYQDDGYHVVRSDSGKVMTWRWNCRVLTARFMPAEAARTFCRIESVRCERVQDITAHDALAEGTGCSSIEAFRNLWNSINEKRGYGWDKNDWVWVVEFETVEV